MNISGESFPRMIQSSRLWNMTQCTGLKRTLHSYKLSCNKILRVKSVMEVRRRRLGLNQTVFTDHSVSLCGEMGG